MTVVTCLVIDGHDYVTIWSSTGRRCVKLALCGQVKMQTRFGPRVVTAFHAWSSTQNVVCRARVYTWSATMANMPRLFSPKRCSPLVGAYGVYRVPGYRSTPITTPRAGF